MAQNYPKQLSAHIDQILASRILTISNVIETLSRTRLVLEKFKLEATYPYLSLYCNWLFHVLIDRNKTGWKILEEIATVFAYHQDDGSNALNRQVSKAFGLVTLRSELCKLFQVFNVRTELVADDENFQKFLGFLLAELEDREICFGPNWNSELTKPALAVRSRIVDLRCKAGVRLDMVVSRVFFLNRSHEISVPGRLAGIYWRVRFLEWDDERAVELNGKFVYA